MGWQDDPLVESAPWENDPIVGSKDDLQMQFEKKKIPTTGLGAFAAGVGQSFPGMDEAAAWIYSKTHDGALYEDTLNTFRQGNEQYAQERPAAFYAGAIAPALIPVGAALKGAQAATKAPLAVRALQGAGIGAAQGAAYGFGSGEGGFDNRLGEAGTGAAFGGVVGGALPLAGGAIKGASDAVVPKISNETAKLAERAQAFGIPLRLDQISPTRARKTVQKVSQELPFSGVDAAEAAQRTQFNNALAKTIGADSLTPDGINSFLDRISDVYSNALKGKIINTSNLNSKLDDVVENARKNVSSDIVGIIQNNVNEIKNDTSKGLIFGQKLGSVRTTLINRLKTADPRAKQYIGDAIEAINSTVEPQIGKEASASLKEAGKEWRNYRTIEPLLEKATSGEINPTELLSRVQSSKYIKASRTSTGEDPLVDLARIGKEFLPKAGGSDTFQKSLFTGGGLYAANSAALNPIIGAATTAATLAGNRSFQKFYNNAQPVVKASISRTLKENPKIINDIMKLPPADARRALIALSNSN